jgi:hypothetical protein
MDADWQWARFFLLTLAARLVVAAAVVLWRKVSFLRATLMDEIGLYIHSCYGRSIDTSMPATTPC